MDKKIMLDPGHGGKDGGAQGNGLSEKELTLTIAKFTQQYLLSEYEGADVRLTRADDRFLELDERAGLANNFGADLFVSIHINASAGASSGGFESYKHNRTTNPATAAAQNVIHTNIMGKKVFSKNRGQKAANFAVLRETNMPALLTENGFINNASDAKILKDQSNLVKLGQAHAQGIAQFLGLKATTQPPATDNLFIVQVGAFEQRANAEKLADDLNKNGYKAYVKET